MGRKFGKSSDIIENYQQSIIEYTIFQKNSTSVSDGDSTNRATTIKGQFSENKSTCMLVWLQYKLKRVLDLNKYAGYYSFLHIKLILLSCLHSLCKTSVVIVKLWQTKTIILQKTNCYINIISQFHQHISKISQTISLFGQHKPSKIQHWNLSEINQFFLIMHRFFV